MKKRTRQQSPGFTLVELAIYGGILMIFLGILSRIFISLLDNQLESQTATAVSQDSRFLFSRLSLDAGRATAIITPGSSGETSNSLRLAINGQEYLYALNANVLELTTPEGTDRLHSIGTAATSVQFSRLGGVGTQSIRMNATLESTTQQVSGAETENFQFTFSLRPK